MYRNSWEHCSRLKKKPRISTLYLKRQDAQHFSYFVRGVSLFLRDVRIKKIVNANGRVLAWTKFELGAAGPGGKPSAAAAPRRRAPPPPAVSHLCRSSGRAMCTEITDMCSGRHRTVVGECGTGRPLLKCPIPFKERRNCQVRRVTRPPPAPGLATASMSIHPVHTLDARAALLPGQLPWTINRPLRCPGSVLDVYAVPFSSGRSLFTKGV